MKIKRKDLKQLIETLLLEGRALGGGPVWSYSPDSDFPAAALKPGTNFPFGKTPKGKEMSVPLFTALYSQRALLFREDDTYQLTPKINTHGGESHSLKHLAELDPQLVYDTMNDLIDLVVDAAGRGEITVPIATIDVNGVMGDIDVDEIRAGDMLNTADQIYDDQIISGFSDLSDNSLEMKIMKRVQQMVKIYDDRVESMTGQLGTTAVVDVSDTNLTSMGITTPKELLSWFAAAPRNIVFAGKFGGGIRSNMYLDTKTTEYVGTQGKSSGEIINTLMAKKKKPPTTWSQVFGDMGNVDGGRQSNTQIDPNTHSIFRAMVDGIKNNDPSLKPYPNLP